MKPNNTLMADTIEARKLNRDPITTVDPNASLTSLKTSSIVSQSALSHPRQADRQSIENQIAQLSEHIHLKLRQCANLVSRGRMDQAGMVCQIIATNRAKLHDLIDKRNAALALPIIQEQPKAHASKLKVRHDPVKRYKMWSDK